MIINIIKNIVYQNIKIFAINEKNCKVPMKLFFILICILFIIVKYTISSANVLKHVILQNLNKNLTQNVTEFRKLESAEKLNSKFQVACPDFNFTAEFSNIKKQGNRITRNYIRNYVENDSEISEKDLVNCYSNYGFKRACNRIIRKACNMNGRFEICRIKNEHGKREKCLKDLYDKTFGDYYQ